MKKDELIAEMRAVMEWPTHEELREFFDALEDCIKTGLAEDGAVSTGFMKFELKRMKPRKHHNIATGKMEKSKEWEKVVAEPKKSLKELFKK